MGLKDDLNSKSQTNTFTLSTEDVQFLAHINQYLQSQLDAIQQHIAAAYLNRIVVDKFKMPAGKDYRFNFDPSKESDNLTVTELIEE